MHKHNINIITSEELVSIIDTDVVLVDCRSSMEYETSHIKNAINIGGTRTLRRDILQHKISVISLINKTVKEYFNKSVDIDDFIIIYDQCSSEPFLLHNQPLARKILEDLIRNFKHVYFLQGGFIGFQSKYTSYCWINKHKLSDEDFVAPSQSMSHLNQSITGAFQEDRSDINKSLIKTSVSSSGQSLTRSQTMMALSRSSHRSDASSTICVKPDNRKFLSCKDSDLSVQQHSLSGPALPFSNQGPTTVLKHLLLGSQKDAMNQSCIQQHKITHVINVSTDGSVCPFVPIQNFLRIPVLDNFTDKITHYFPKAFEFLDNAKSVGGKVLVHCSAGISRSPTLAIGYLMKTQNISVTDAYNIVKLSRSSVSPNFNFLGQLTDYEEELRIAREDVKTPSTLDKSSQSRPKRRPTRLGFLSTFLRQSTSSNKSNIATSPTSENSLGNCSLTTAQKLTTPLLPSPSVPFAKLGINSPLDESPNLTLKIDNFPSTSLDQLHFQPCQTGPRGVKIKRSATESGNDSSKIRKRFSMNDSSYSLLSCVSQKISIDNTTCDSHQSQTVGTSDAFHRRHSAILSSTTNANDTSIIKSNERDHLSASNRSISYERLNCCSEANNWNTTSSIISADSCRLQECHQSTSSLSSANSHSSNLLV